MVRKALTALALTLALAASSVVSASASPIDTMPPLLASIVAFVTAQDVVQEEGDGGYNREAEPLDGSIFDDGVGGSSGPIKGSETEISGR